MIAYLEGTIHSIEHDRMIVLVNGVGYAVYMPLRLISHMSIGQNVFLSIFHYIRENTSDLYGFTEQEDYHFFQKLLQVSGVGPHLACALLSHYSAEEMKRAILHGNASVLSQVSGVGKKTAERIVLDLKDSIDIASSVAGPTLSSAAATAADALMALGYTKPEAFQALQNVDHQLSTEDQIREALKQLSS